MRVAVWSRGAALASGALPRTGVMGIVLPGRH